MRWVPAFGGIAVLVLAITVMSSLNDEPVAVQASDSAPIAAHDPAPDRSVEIDELDPNVSALLESSGYTEFIGRSELGAELPESIVETLVRSGSVLVIPSDGGS